MIVNKWSLRHIDMSLIEEVEPLEVERLPNEVAHVDSFIVRFHLKPLDLRAFTELEGIPDVLWIVSRKYTI